MKLRVGMISPNREDSEKLRKEFPDLYLTYGKDIMEFVRNLPSQPMEALVFVAHGNLAQEFKAAHSFIRSKAPLAKVPITILYDGDFELKNILQDPLVRSFSRAGGMFLPLMEFFNVVKDTQALERAVPEDKIEVWFENALSSKLGQGTGFLSRAANNDEAREAFFCQKADEVACNLLWIKFSARILEKGSEGLKGMYASFSEPEMIQMTEKILEMAFTEFKTEINSHLTNIGAAKFLTSDKLAPADRSPFIKNAKSKAILFESSPCAILLEVIRYF